MQTARILSWLPTSRLCCKSRRRGHHAGTVPTHATITHFLEGFLETAVPMIAGLAEVVGLFIIITSLAKASYHYVRATFFNDHHDFHHEMSSGLTTALEFLMSAEIAKTLLLQNL